MADSTDEGRKDTPADLPADAERKALFPETHRKSAQLLGKEVSLRPLPISWAKRIKAILDEANALITDAEQDADVSDELLACHLRAAALLGDFYGTFDAGLSDEAKAAAVADAMAAPEVLGLISAQLNLNGENDFLLNGSRWHIALLNEGGRRTSATIETAIQAIRAFPSLQSSPPSPSPTADSPTSPEIIPAGN